MTDPKPTTKTQETAAATESGTRTAAPVLQAVEPASSRPAAGAAKKAGTAKPVSRGKKAKKAAPKVTVKSTARPAAGKPTTSKTEKTMTQGKYQFDRLTQDAVKGSREQIDAAMKTGNLLMKGIEDVTRTYMSWAQSSAERNSQAVKALMSCKTINEFAETQNKWAQQNFDDFMAGATKLSEVGVRIATDALEPINDQFSKNLKKAVDSVAA